ncbi:(d)CMP kinase [Lactobacillus iners]|jgi:cytidylate kinase|uniref:Cytidylate kinase n=1 Tax=Lactobacillus iners TaxID=147802 RepID=A0A6G7B903_9LACO|nr:(d)CMP kinase [Lactobacillus iners]MCT7675944.1 (d)CMP kinase [Lactobacillus iners]MCT7676876.1 (d)CMP kinase [Lactobacillus iners]MCT7728443.1 (d)CMP kinase [Lactobacillus iners]MCT7729850.1 (d)CMP kinase [Lactobacillus iners]MCT7735267.1 (d)CMP kinase [Lactobacillus iners]
MQVAIDGPASAGKSTVAKIIAKNMGYIYLDTGAMYRACTLVAKQNHLAYDDQSGILKALNNNIISFKNIDDDQRVYINDKDVSFDIRTPEITANVSQVSALSEIRKKMVEIQRKIAGENNIIMDGRDIGTTVLPDADVKIFLIASVASRAKRRYLDFKEKGINQNLTDIEKDIADRDYKDMHRKISPLRKAEDAYQVDTTDMSIDQVVNKLTQIIKKNKKNK